jgi:hypothetical protein
MWIYLYKFYSQTILKIVGALSKMKPCTRSGPKIGKKTLASCDVQTFDNLVNAVVGANKKE